MDKVTELFNALTKLMGLLEEEIAEIKLSPPPPLPPPPAALPAVPSLPPPPTVMQTIHLQAARFVIIDLFAAMTGYTPKAVRRKIEDGQWREGLEYRRAPDGHVLIDIEGYYRWVEKTGKRPQSAARHQL